MNFSGELLNAEKYKRLGLKELEQLYKNTIFPHLNNGIETTCELFESIRDEDKFREDGAIALSLIQEVHQLYNAHYINVTQLLTFFIEKNVNRESAVSQLTIPQLISDHHRIQDVFKTINRLSNQLGNDFQRTSLHRLAYAHINNISQDVARVFFLEEEYLFPRLFPLLQRNE
ncbi:MAG: hypothetical protein ABIQ40_02405 [Bacteroidia bacterium]